MGDYGLRSCQLIDFSSLCQWDLEEAKRVAEFVQKGVNYTSACFPKAGYPVFVTGSDGSHGMLKEIDMKKGVVRNCAVTFLI